MSLGDSRMRLYVVRHAKARRDSASGLDEDRELKGRGRRQADRLAARLSQADRAPTLVLASRFARARQTAEPIAEACDCDLEFVPDLECGHGTDDVIALIESAVQAGRHEAIAVVGHNPTLSDVVETMCEEVHDLWLRTGEAAVIDVDPVETRFIELWRLDEGD